jgi:hypothetical protein
MEEFHSSFGEIPAGKNAFAVLGAAGDTKTMWDPNNADEVAEARLQFERLVASKRFSAFRISDEDPNKKGERMKEFDPRAGRVIFIPPVAGGA